ncbi:MAG: IS1634 family transposase [Nanoarchaeota archaeon]|nr:IS1634 family transposase [Nanoarchaeota archaeon]
MGKLELAKEHWKALADRIETMVLGQGALFSVAPEVESIAEHYADVIIQNRLVISPQQEPGQEEPSEYETIDVKSVAHGQSRSIGAEHVGLSMFRQLELDRFLKKLSFSDKEIALSALSVVGKLVHPASELGTKEWAESLSGIDELLGVDFRHISQNALYRISDNLFSHKEAIEKHLREKEKNLFSLEERIILYDLTNTYFEGQAKQNKKAKRGRSKDKQNGRPLVTLGLVIDEHGFPKKTELFSGNVSEGNTLLEMIDRLCERKDKKDTTVILDAGIAKEENLALLKSQGYQYVCVARNRPVESSEIKRDSLITVKEDKQNKVEVQLVRADKEHILYCKSSGKQQKEQAMKSLFQKRFEDGLRQIEQALKKKGGVKRYEKVVERIGRLKERYALIGQYYAIEVTEAKGIAAGLRWKLEKADTCEERFSGSYFLRTSRTDLNEKKLWSLYIMLTNVENAFRSLKHELELRPVYHQKENRSDGHLFITIAAYHLLNSIQYKLKAANIHMEWRRVREYLSNHTRITTAMTTKEGKRIYLRNSSTPEPFHRRIYSALRITATPLKQKRIQLKNL